MGESNNHLEGATDKVGALIAADQQHQFEIFGRATGGSLKPRHQYLERTAGSLAIGECVIEPHLGSVRVAGSIALGRFVQLAWSDDHSPCRPVGRYPTDQAFSVRTPALQDQLVVRQAIDQAQRRNADIEGDAARLIAAHLYLGPRSAIYRFAMNGAFDDRLFDELEQINQHRTQIRPWIQAFGRYCVGRTYRGPVPAWRRPAEPMPSETAKAAIPNVAKSRRKTSPASSIRRETVTAMLDAAFQLGMLAARARSQRRAYLNLAHLRVGATAASGSRRVG